MAKGSSTTIAVTVSDAKLIVGRTQVDLWRDAKLTVKCQIKTKPPIAIDSGIAGETDYSVQCDHDEYDEHTVRYTVHQGDLLIAQSALSPFDCRLLDTVHHSARIRIRAIDMVNAENTAIAGEQTVTVKQKTLGSVAEMMDFLVGQHPQSIRSESNAGNIAVAIVMIHILTAQLTHELNCTDAERRHIVEVALGIVGDMALPGPAEHVRMVIDVIGVLVNVTELLHHYQALHAGQVMYRAVSVFDVLQVRLCSTFLCSLFVKKQEAQLDLDSISISHLD